MKKIYTAARACTTLLGLAALSANAQPSYCNSGLGGSYCGDHITNVTIVNTTFNNSSGCNVNGNGDTYTSFAPGMGTTETLTVGLVYTISITTDASNIESFWIDFDQDGQFEPSEWTQPTLNSTANVATTATVLIPVNATFGLTGFRVRSRGTGNQNGAGDACLGFGSGETEDYVITIAPGQPCTSTPAPNTVVATQTLICPVFGTAGLGLATSYTVGGINYTWYQSTQGAFGPWTAVPNATMMSYSTPTLSGTTYYMVTASCINGGVTMSATPVQIDVASTTTNNVTYTEGFEGITVNKQLPNCSWFRSDAYQAGSQIAFVNTWRSARTGTKFAEFDASNGQYGQTRYFYSNGIQLYPGITYSASVWYNTPGYSTWYNLTLLYGPNQSPSGLTQLAIVNYPSNSNYESMSGTFQVPTAGLYYLSVKATENYYGSQLVWDDLRLEAPCQFSNNAASIALTGTTTVCAGQTVNIAATGASTYSWSTGSNANNISVSPAVTTIYSVTGANPMSGCTGVAYKTITVNQLPVVGVFASANAVCEGKSVNMVAVGASSYTWSAGPTMGPAITVTPASNANTYTVIGKDALGCQNSYVQSITVNPLPVVAVTGQTLICQGNSTDLTGTGAGVGGTYEWSSNSSFLNANPANVSPVSTTAYTVTGTDANGCKGVGSVVVAVDPCLGLQSYSGSSNSINVYPNPNNGVFTVVMTNADEKNIEVVDVTGRVVFSASTVSNATDINITALASGVYYVKVKSATANDVVKVVKQ